MREVKKAARKGGNNILYGHEDKTREGREGG